MKQQSLRQWFRWLTRWIRRIFQKPETFQPTLLILERTYSADESIVLLSVERDAPGAVGTWYLLNQHNPRHNLLITLDNLAAIRLALDANSFSDRDTSILELSLAQEDQIFRTHRFSVQWIIKLKSSRKVFHLIGTWDLDLQGDTWDPNTSAFTIGRLVAREALNLPPLPGVSWRFRMTEFPWIESLQSYSKMVLGDNHNCYTKKLNLKELKELRDEIERERGSRKRHKS